MKLIRCFVQNFSTKFKSSTSLPCALRNMCTVTDNADFQEKKIRVADCDINYMKTGTGPFNLLLMPGALGSIWTDFEPQIKGLNKDLFTIVAWDPPGYGKSIPPYREFPLNFYEKDADVALLLMRALEIKKFSLLGWSDGGISSMFLAAKYPEYVKKAVIWGSNSYIMRTELKLYEAVRDVKKWSKRMREPMVNLYGEEYFSDTWSKWCDGVQNIYDKNRGDICMKYLQSIKCPMFILYGSKDQMVDPAHVSILSSNITKSKVHIYPEGGHNIHLKYADDFNTRITEFLTGNI